MSTRTGGAGYHEYEFSDLDHIKASEVLKQCFGYVIVNGYSCQLYTDLYESYGWRRVDKEAQVSGGGKRIESLWLSPRTWNALQNDYSISIVVPCHRVIGSNGSLVGYGGELWRKKWLLELEGKYENGVQTLF